MADKKTLKEIQKVIDEWILKHGGYWPPLSMLSGIIEELGELSREINYLEGFKPKKSLKPPKKESFIGEELGDLLFSIICLANHYKVDLNEKVHKTFKKYFKRDATRFI